MNFSDNLKSLMIENNLTQKKISEIAQVNQRTISSWINGQNEPLAYSVAKIADYFHVSVDYLLGREDDLGNISISGSPASELTTIEKELIETFRRLPPNLQGIAIQTLHSFAGDQERKDQSDTLPRRA